MIFDVAYRILGCGQCYAGLEGSGTLVRGGLESEAGRAELAGCDTQVCLSLVNLALIIFALVIFGLVILGLINFGG